MSMLFDEERKLGFDFELCKRNQFLTEKGVVNPPKFLKTGTTITGLVFDGGIVLGADTRATEGPIVADKNCEKIHYIAPNIYCCGAGTAADTENTTALISSQLTLHRMATGKQSRVVTACTLLKRFLFQYQGHVSAALVLGGVDVTGPHLYTIHPHGSVDELPYVTMGSGSLAAMAVFEAGFRPGLSETEAKDLVHASICAGIFNDLGSGSNVDLCVIRTGGVVEYFRNYDRPNDVSVVRAKQYTYPRGTTPVLKTVVQDIRQLVDVEEGPAPMEI